MLSLTRRAAARLACSGLALSLIGGFAAAQEKTIVWVDGGGAYHDAVQKEVLDTWESDGVKVVPVAGTDNAKLRAMVEANRVEWDVYNGDNTWGTETDGKWLEPLDYSVIKKDDIIPGFASTYRIANMIYSIQLAYNNELIKTKPAGWSDFFDLEKFPGKRGIMDYSAGGIFEIALLADGAAPDKLYPLDIDRAIRKLDTIKSSIVYWQSGAQSEELVGSGEVSMVMTYNARAYDAKVALQLPVDYIFEQQILAAAYLTVPKGSKNLKEAMSLIAHAVSPEINGKLTETLPLAPSNSKSAVNEAMSADLPTSHLDKAYAIFDDQWIGENSAMLEQRFQAWKSAN